MAGILLNVESLLIWHLNYQRIPILSGGTAVVPYFQDLLGLVFLLIAMGSGFMAGRPGMVGGGRTAVQWGSALMLVFTARIMILDPSEFLIRVTDWQAASGVFTWFTNADLLLVSAGLLVLSTLVRGSKAPP